MRLGELKEHIKFFENNSDVNDFSEVIIGKHGTSGLVDGANVQVKVTDVDIQVLANGSGQSALTIVHTMETAAGLKH